MPGWTRRQALSSMAAPFVLRGAGRPLNVLFILTDDHGAWALHSYGCHEIHTPHLDRLAAEGVRFTRAYACTPVCSASRATWLTGRLPSRDGVQDWLLTDDCVGPTAKDFLAGQTTIADVFHRNGYATGISGEWHLGHDDRAHAGFDSWSVVPGGGGAFRDATFDRDGTRTPSADSKTISPPIPRSISSKPIAAAPSSSIWPSSLPTSRTISSPRTIASGTPLPPFPVSRTTSRSWAARV